MLAERCHLAIWEVMAKQQTTSLSLAIEEEFDGMRLPDARLESRARKSAKRIWKNPDTVFPLAMTTAELEGFYRLINNSRVTFEQILKPHVESTLGRVSHFEEVAVVHDTTLFGFGGNNEREGLTLRKRGKQGFFGHFSIAVTCDAARDPLGVLAISSWTRSAGQSASSRRRKGVDFTKTIGEPKEQDRWGAAVDRVEEQATSVSYVHIMDREADDYALLAKMIENKRRFVVRLCYDRCLDNEQTGSKTGQKTKEFMATRPVVCERQVSLSRRGDRRPNLYKRSYPSRSERKAKLSFAASRVVLKRPPYHRDMAPTIEVNVIHVRESKTPKGMEAVEWFLLTTEPVDTEEQILKVVDLYRGRWRIEEYFKALKTGCAYEKRQFETLKGLLNTLAMLAPIAWGIMRLRTMEREKPKAPAGHILTRTQIAVLRRVSKRRLPPNLSIQRALQAIADLGGHLRNNGPPGWQVLGRGYEKLLTLEVGYQTALQEMR